MTQLSHIYTSVALLVTLLASGCVSAPTPQRLPEYSGEAIFEIERADVLDVTNHMIKHLDDDKQILYNQNRGGGGAPLGLALGVIGVVANMNMIDNETEANVAQLKGRLTAAPAKAFLDAALFSGVSIYSDTSSSIKLSPYLLVSRLDGDQLGLAAAMFVTYDDTGIEWSGKYMSELPIRTTLGQAANGLDFENNDRLYGMLVANYENLLNLFHADMAVDTGSEQDLLIRSKLVTFGLNGEMPAIGIGQPTHDRVNVRLPGGVFSLLKDRTQVRAAAPQ